MTWWWVWPLPLVTPRPIAAKSENKDTDKLDNYALNIYGQWQHTRWSTEVILGLGINRHHRQRYVSASQPLIADYQSDYANVRLSEGYTMTRGNWSIEPLMGLNYTRVRTDQHQEKDPANTGSAVVTAASNRHTLEVGAGLAIQRARAFAVAKGQLTPAAKVMAWYDVAKHNQPITSRLLIREGARLAPVAFPPLLTASLEADLSLSYVRNQSTLVVGYNHNQEIGLHSNNYYLQFKYDF